MKTLLIKNKLAKITKFIIISFIFLINFTIITPHVLALQDQWELITPVGACGTFNTVASINDYIYLGTSQGIYKSSNQGASWGDVGLPTASISSIAIGWTYDFDNSVYTFNDDTSVFITTSNGVYKSTLGSDTWELVTSSIFSDIKFDQYQAVLLGSASTIYAAGSDGVYRSDNSGADWVLTDTGLEGKSIKKLATEFTGDLSSGNVFALTETNELYSSALFSVDGVTPESWNQLYATSTNINNISIVNALGGIEFLATENGILKSSDSGVNWIETNTGLNGLSIKSVQNDYVDSNIIYLANGDLGIFKSIDEGLNWYDANLGINDYIIKEVSTNPTTSTLVYAIGNNDIFRLNLSDSYIIPVYTDTTAPSQVSLNSLTWATSTIELGWIAPGDDGDIGTATLEFPHFIEH